MKTIEMWNINGHQLNLGYVPDADKGISIWEEEEHSFRGYKDSKLYLYERVLGLQFVDKDLQHNIEYIDQFMDTAYISSENSSMALSDLAIWDSSPRAALRALKEEEDTIYSYLFVCYVWLKFNKSEQKGDVAFYGFGDSNFLWNGIIHTAYEDGKLKATYEEYYNGWESESNRELKLYTGYITLEDVKTMIRMEARDATKYLLNLLGYKCN